MLAGNLGLLGFFAPGPFEMIVIGIVAVLLFGKRLPEVGRSIGKGLMEFKRGIRGIEDDIDRAATTRPTSSSSRYSDADDREEATAPKFEPPPEEPRPASEPTNA
jgi:sec-independent protein translocase protein TatA